MIEAALIILIAILFSWMIGVTVLVLYLFDTVHSVLNIQEQIHSAFIRGEK